VILGEIHRKRPEPQDVRAIIAMRSSGLMVLPSDFDIFMPLASMVKPWVRIAL
jgi:hypothetical protein